MRDKVLVTGAAGFIGSHVAKKLSKDYDVLGLDDLSGGYEENISPYIKFVKGSINDTVLIAELFKNYKFKYVFHLAAYAAEGLSHFIRKFNYENNLIGSINLINESIKNKSVECFVFTSSIAVYGTGNNPLKETDVLRPEDPYGISKYAIELDLKCAHEMFGLNSIIFRPHNVYGENQNINDPYRNVIGIFINQILQNKELTIFGDGFQTRAFSYIDCVSDMIAASISQKDMYNEVYNIGSDKPYSILEIANLISKKFNKELKLKFLEQRNEVKHAVASHNKIKKTKIYQSDIDLEDGLELMCKWAINQKIKEPIKFKNIEILEKLPMNWR